MPQLLAVQERFGFGPTIDGAELLSEPWRLLQQGHVAPGVPVVAGSVSEDCSLGFNELPSTKVGPWGRHAVLSAMRCRRHLFRGVGSWAASTPPLATTLRSYTSRSQPLALTPPRQPSGGPPSTSLQTLRWRESAACDVDNWCTLDTWLWTRRWPALPAVLPGSVSTLNFSVPEC